MAHPGSAPPPPDMSWTTRSAHSSSLGSGPSLRHKLPVEHAASRHVCQCRKQNVFHAECHVLFLVVSCHVMPCMHVRGQASVYAHIHCFTCARTCHIHVLNHYIDSCYIAPNVHDITLHYIGKQLCIHHCKHT